MTDLLSFPDVMQTDLLADGSLATVKRRLELVQTHFW